MVRMKDAHPFIAEGTRGPSTLIGIFNCFLRSKRPVIYFVFHFCTVRFEVKKCITYPGPRGYLLILFGNL